jgi:hypothetical protein
MIHRGAQRLFGIDVAGNHLRFEIDGPAFFEHVPPFTYLDHTCAAVVGPSAQHPLCLSQNDQMILTRR